uniref:Uncharacterized protein n=1 Tax=Cacopsylla melanoneura TaxID=428564 RepID=A0A8D9BSL5_9HEMI
MKPPLYFLPHHIFNIPTSFKFSLHQNSLFVPLLNFLPPYSTENFPFSLSLSTPPCKKEKNTTQRWEISPRVCYCSCPPSLARPFCGKFSVSEKRSLCFYF